VSTDVVEVGDHARIRLRFERALWRDHRFGELLRTDDMDARLALLQPAVDRQDRGFRQLA
jgi:hypothetical protein